MERARNRGRTRRRIGVGIGGAAAQWRDRRRARRCAWRIFLPEPDDHFFFPQAFGRAIAIIILGALIGFFIGLVGELLKRGWLMVVRSQSRNAREGREYPLIKGVTIIGRAEESDIGLFGDQSVLGSHAIIRREGKNFIISPTGGQIFVNRHPVAGRYALKSGDWLQVGGTLFLFRERAQARSTREG